MCVEVSPILRGLEENDARHYILKVCTCDVYEGSEGSWTPTLFCLRDRAVNDSYNETCAGGLSADGA